MNFLNEILEVKKEEVKKLKGFRKLSTLGEEEFFDKEPLNFSQSIKNDNRLGLIAEIKKASPSKGIIKENFNHIKIAKEYMQSGVDVISVLTDEKFFQGNIHFLKEITQIKNVPLLRKDFIIDAYQIYEAKANGADAVLLIAEALSAAQINELTNAAHECNLEVLLELHSREQFSKIDFRLNKIIGINNRNLETFQVDLETTISLSQQIPDDLLIVSESGYSSKSDLDKIKKRNINAVLVGEYFMKKNNLNESIKEFLEWSAF